MTRRDGGYARANEHITNCERCAKRTFETARQARRRAKLIPGPHMNVYPCPYGPGFHLGHLPVAVVRGEIPKETYQAIVQARRDRLDGIR